MAMKSGWRPIKSFKDPARSPPPPSKPTPSNALAREAVRIASSPGGIDGRQMPLKPTNGFATKGDWGRTRF